MQEQCNLRVDGDIPVEMQNVLDWIVLCTLLKNKKKKTLRVHLLVPVRILFCKDTLLLCKINFGKEKKNLFWEGIFFISQLNRIQTISNNFLTSEQ